MLKSFVTQTRRKIVILGEAEAKKSRQQFFIARLSHLRHSFTRWRLQKETLRRWNIESHSSYFLNLRRVRNFDDSSCSSSLQFSAPSIDFFFYSEPVWLLIPINKSFTSLATQHERESAFICIINILIVQMREWQTESNLSETLTII